MSGFGLVQDVLFQEVKFKNIIKDHVVVAWSNLVNYTQSYVLSGSFTEKFFKKIIGREERTVCVHCSTPRADD